MERVIIILSVIKSAWLTFWYGPPCPKHPGHRPREVDMDLMMPMCGMSDMCSECFEEMEAKWR